MLPGGRAPVHASWRLRTCSADVLPEARSPAPGRGASGGVHAVGLQVLRVLWLTLVTVGFLYLGAMTLVETRILEECEWRREGSWMQTSLSSRAEIKMTHPAHVGTRKLDRDLQAAISLPGLFFSLANMTI
jgi:hypothetical protein